MQNIDKKKHLGIFSFSAPSLPSFSVDHPLGSKRVPSSSSEVLIASVSTTPYTVPCLAMPYTVPYHTQHHTPYHALPCHTPYHALYQVSMAHTKHSNPIFLFMNCECNMTYCIVTVRYIYRQCQTTRCNEGTEID